MLWIASRSPMSSSLQCGLYRREAEIAGNKHAISFWVGTQSVGGPGAKQFRIPLRGHRHQGYDYARFVGHIVPGFGSVNRVDVCQSALQLDTLTLNVIG